MKHMTTYKSPLGPLLLESDEKGLTGLWFYGSKYFPTVIAEPDDCIDEGTILGEAKRWLDIYFSGKDPDFMPIIHFEGTEFQIIVWKLLCGISYASTISYGEIAKKVAESKGIEKMSAQAVGGAVGHNKIGILVPCHRVVGADGSLTGYAGGIDKKRKLLQLEKRERALWIR